MADLTHKRLIQLLHYDSETGTFTRLVTKGLHVRAASEAGSVARDHHGRCSYRQIVIDGKRYRAHRLAFFYMTGAWPTLDIDHKDGDGLNNRWNNLREATGTQNQANRGAQSDNMSGFKGVSFHKVTRKFRAQIKINYKQIHLGSYTTAEAAAAAYVAAAKKYFGEFARVK